MKFKYFLSSVLCLFLLTACNNKSESIYLDSNYSDQERVEDLLTRMTLEEKVAQMCQYVGLNYLSSENESSLTEEILNSDSKASYKGFLKKDIAQMVVDGKIGSFLHVLEPQESNILQALALKSRLKIPLIIGIDAIHGNGMVKGTTVYPSPITISSSFTDTLAYQVGIQTAKEIRAAGSHWAFTPNIDVLRDPRWGRVGETFGEDPLLVSNMGSSMIKGLQETNKVIACAKHFIAGSEPVNGLNASPMDISDRNMREIYLKPFKKAVESGVYSVMAAHNELNGIPCHMNKYLMTDILREELQFKGFIVSDWMDIERIHTLHKIAENNKDASFLSVDAGMDMHMHGPYFLEHVVELVKENKISEKRIDESVRKILLAKIKLGLFENPFIDLEEVDNKIFTKEHKNTSLEIARKSIVLLKNSNRTLPINFEKKNRILVTGPNANNHSILGDWTKPQPEENVVTIFEGIEKIGSQKGFEVDFFDSNSDILNISENDILSTVDIAKDYDYVFVVVGDNSLRHLNKKKTAGENMARSKINLAGNQLKLVKSLEKLTNKLVVVYVNGKPIAEPWIEDNIDAIIEAWEPGSFGGQAVGEIIFGDVNPSGKLPLTFPRSVGQLQMVYNHKPSQYFHKYAQEKITPLYSFGHGLSYSEFVYSNLVVKKSTIKDSIIKISFSLTNESEFEGEEVVQLYFRDSYSSVTRPVKELLDYKRISMKPNESKQIYFNIPIKKLAFYDINMKNCVEKGNFEFMVGGSSKESGLVKDSFYLMDRYDF
ncbi:MAG: glycoside hydrolase family 3 C-terminal domain-containing protein [Flavobacteriales bacterium]|nr:glycoside hydrolase family 3 C-terminal domain-containing protein [Flavobacteriales bacterium]